MSFSLPPEQFTNCNIEVSPICNDFYEVNAFEPKATKLTTRGGDGCNGSPDGGKSMSDTKQRLSRVESEQSATQGKLSSMEVALAKTATQEGLNDLKILLTEIKGQLQNVDTKIDGRLNNIDTKLGNIETKLGGYVTKLWLVTSVLGGVIAIVGGISGFLYWSCQQYLLPILQSLGKAAVGA